MAYASTAKISRGRRGRTTLTCIKAISQVARPRTKLQRHGRAGEFVQQVRPPPRREGAHQRAPRFGAHCWAVVPYWPRHFTWRSSHLDKYGLIGISFWPPIGGQAVDNPVGGPRAKALLAGSLGRWHVRLIGRPPYEDVDTHCAAWCTEPHHRPGKASIGANDESRRDDRVYPVSAAV